MTKRQKILLPIVIIIITLILSQIIVNNPPKSQRGKGNQAAQMTVEVKKLKAQRYDINIESFGVVKPRTQSILVAQVSGQIKQISPKFREGGFFEQGDVLVTLDDRDYQAEQKIAQASLMSAKQGLLEEQARVEQAILDWSRLGNGEKPSALVLREPQLAAAKAQVLSAQAQLQKSELALERSKIVAPYAGRILQKSVDIGQVVSANTQLAEIYAIDYVEIRLPIKNNDLALMLFPEEYRNQANHQRGSDVLLTSNLIGTQQWHGQVLRTEGAIDANSQQLYIVAQIDDPYDREKTQSTPIKIGQYVTAQIKGQQIENAIIIPNSAIYQGSYVYIVENNLLKRKEISIRWQNANEAIIATGLSVNDQLVVTALGQVSSGTPVKILGKKPLNRAEKSKVRGNSKLKKGDQGVSS